MTEVEKWFDDLVKRVFAEGRVDINFDTNPALEDAVKICARQHGLLFRGSSVVTHEWMDAELARLFDGRDTVSVKIAGPVTQGEVAAYCRANHCQVKFVNGWAIVVRNAKAA